jgi:hypothetical protein
MVFTKGKVQQSLIQEKFPWLFSGSVLNVVVEIGPLQCRKILPL